MLEEERKYEVSTDFVLPDLAACVPDGGRLITCPVRKLRATYYDTRDLRLARSGASLRFRRGDDEPWTAKVPTDTTGIRDEISMSGNPLSPPQRLLDLLTAYTRSAAVSPVTTLHTARRAYQLCDHDDRVAVEVVDDVVTVVEGRRNVLTFREIEVERKAGKAKLLDRVEAVLLGNGAVAGEFTPKHVRALGLPALQPADWPDPTTRLPKKASAGDVAQATIIRDVARLVRHDPLVRLRAPVGTDDTAVHQMRVGCRRLRSDLRTFSLIVDRDWAEALRDELGWLGESLGAARDAEVLRARLLRTARADSLAPLDAVAVARIDADLAARYEDATAALDKQMCTDRYHRLLDSLMTACVRPKLQRRAAQAATELLVELVTRSWHRFAEGGNGEIGAGQLDLDGADDSWHAARIRGKRVRYAADAAAAVVGGPAIRLASALAAVQDVLGEHQDAAVAADTWLSIANADPDDYALAITAGRLYERERGAVRAARAAFAPVWRDAVEQFEAWSR